MREPRPTPRTALDKLWEAHEILRHPGGPSLLYVSRVLVHDGSFHAFEMLRDAGLAVRRPAQVFGTADHYVSTDPGRVTGETPEIRRVLDLFERNMRDNAIAHFAAGTRGQGIVHVVGPEQGITLPGTLLVCGDSHTSTHGGLGAFAFGIGQSELAHVLATQTIWQHRPRRMRIAIEGRLGRFVSAKDVILAVIARIGISGAMGFMIEYAGSAVRALSVEERLTLCNMSIEAAARAGMVAADDKVFDYLHGRPHAPQGAGWDRAVAIWRQLGTDPGAVFDREVTLDATAIAPMVSWGTTPEQTLPIDARVPWPAAEPDPARRAQIEASLAYMDLTPGRPLSEIGVDVVFIGSCTNGRIEDLRAAAEVLRGRRTTVRTLVVPGSGQVREQAQAEGLDRIFRAAGAEWREAGCSMCVAMNGDIVAPGQRCASTSNRNFAGRQGIGARTHLMSPAMAAAAAVAGRLTDVRRLEAVGP
ncbi:MAG: 3-isopropylmalate dehydratase large subunit [Rhodobacteraceae bacterium]|jgi:3-isopropylmalate/(R)-2-methylmalate dehydratase large subunit|nr:3-isopropylmalate dehydratase large subunit [Paracoccaceae bacterium]